VTPERGPRVRAPELVGRGGWLNTGGTAYALADLRGRIVLLDFWTFCCINCLHVLDELRPLEEKYADVLVVVGVHSPKFAHEADHEAVADAVERYAVHHPVLDDPDLTTWSAYAVRAWPTLVVVDPEGYVVAQLSGEGHAHGLDALVAELVAEHDARGTLHRGDGPYVPRVPLATTLRFPAKALLLPTSAHLLVADAGHHSLAEMAGDGETLVRRIGAGDPGLLDGGPDVARFDEPNGLCLLPGDVAEAVGYDVVVADTVNHVLRGMRLDSGAVTTVAGTGQQWMPTSPDPPDGAAREQDLSSPWDVAWSPGDRVVYVAMAGVHQLWAFDPLLRTVRATAGTRNEGLRDGAAATAWFAQPSGLAVSDDPDGQGERLWVADAETSALRSVRAGVVVTHAGQGLFEFGHRDGPAERALLQHPLGVAALPDGSVAVLDTYNDAVRRYDPVAGEVTTLATGLREPSGAVLVPADDGRPDLVVVESAAHRLVRLRLPEHAVRVPATELHTQRPVVDVAPGAFDLAVVFEPPPGQKLDDRYGPSTRLLVSASPPGLLVEGDGSGTDLWRLLVLSDAVPEGVLHVAAFAASCDDSGAVEFPACHVHQQDWGIPVRVRPGGDHRLALVLMGLDRAS
jgi:thiol-disulfide isomerase/thioredoxin/DNA-binding beta-propeller fold protein YncE